MIKKISIFVGVLFSFFLMFLFGFDKINVLAYSDISSSLGSYPVKLDIENYNRQNLFDSVLEQNVYVYSSGAKVGGGANYVCSTNKISVIAGRYITLSTTTNINVSESGFVFFNNGLYVGYSKGVLTAIVPTNANEVVFNFYTNSGLSPSQFSNVQVEYGSTATDYAPMFKFGYNVGYSVILNNSSNNNFVTTISILSSNITLYTGSCTIQANTSTLCNSGSVLYIPFNIDLNGYVSLYQDLRLVIADHGLTINYQNSGLFFENVFNAYYKGSPTTKLYFKNSYVLNNIYLSGFNVSINSDINSNITFYTNNYDDSYSITTNKTINLATNKIIETASYNNVEYNYFFNSPIYNFVIDTAVPNVNINNSRIYQISISNLMSRVVGNSDTNVPTPINPNTINKYNSCSAWYDIPCQLGNGLTYVIYEAPIISPVLTFIVSFITMFSSLVSFVDLFRSFGIVFGCFIFYMFINLLHKYSK